jgi:hypothetical protein
MTYTNPVATVSTYCDENCETVDIFVLSHNVSDGLELNLEMPLSVSQVAPSPREEGARKLTWRHDVKGSSN